MSKVFPINVERRLFAVETEDRCGQVLWAKHEPVMVCLGRRVPHDHGNCTTREITEDEREQIKHLLLINAQVPFVVKGD